jgi:Tfp pilus assembly protein PilV
MALTSSDRTHAPIVRQRTSNRGGFALISLMVALFLLSIGVMAVGAANVSRIREQTSATTRARALNIARSHLEELRARDAWSITTEPGTAVNDDGAPSAGGAGTFMRSVAVTIERPNLITVLVEVRAPRLINPVRLSTQLYRGGTMTIR